MINDDSHAIPKSPRLSSAQGLEAHTLEFGVIKPGSGLHHRRWCCTCQILLSCHKTVHLSFTLFSSLLEGIQHPIAIRFNRRQILPVGFELLFVFCFTFFFSRVSINFLAASTFFSNSACAATSSLTPFLISACKSSMSIVMIEMIPLVS